MVFRVPEQDEHEMASMASHLHLVASKRLQTDALGPSLHLWRCPAEPHPAVAFWIGDCLCLSYLGLYPTKLGALDVLQGKRAWTASTHRRRGFGTALLRAAAQEAALMTDIEGMTASAYYLWSSAHGLTLRWWDTHRAMFVFESDVPVADRFTYWEQEGKRYQLVLSI